MSLEEHVIIRESVRKRPGMYFGTTGPRGLIHLIYEVIGNPINLFLQNQVSTIDIQITESLSCLNLSLQVPRKLD
jgi:DNA gyrase subunit B